jgi:hypothetical protein
MIALVMPGITEWIIIIAVVVLAVLVLRLLIRAGARK